MQQNSEKRHKFRANLKLPLPVLLHPEQQLIGHVMNISAGGVGVLSDRNVRYDDRIWATLRLPGKTQQWQTASVHLEPAWHRYNDSEHVMSIGFKFIDLEAQTLFAIQRLMDDASSIA